MGLIFQLVLCKQSRVSISGIERIELALIVLAWNADQKIRKIISGLTPSKNEVAVELSNGLSIHLIKMQVTAKLHRMISSNSGDRLGQFVGVVCLFQFVRSRADRIAVEHDVLDALPSRIERHDTRRALRRDKALGGETDAGAAQGLAQIVVIANVAQVKLVDRVWAQNLCVSDRKELSAAGREGIEARNVRATLRRWVRIVEVVIVQKVVGGNQSPAGVSVKAQSLLCDRVQFGCMKKWRMYRTEC